MVPQNIYSRSMGSTLSSEGLKVSKAETIKGKYKSSALAKLKFPEGWGQKALRGYFLEQHNIGILLNTNAFVRKAHVFEAPNAKTIETRNTDPNVHMHGLSADAADI